MQCVHSKILRISSFRGHMPYKKIKSTTIVRASTTLLVDLYFWALPILVRKVVEVALD